MRFVKINFDGSVRGAKGGIEFVSKDLEGRLLVAGGFTVFEPFLSQKLSLELPR